MSDKHTNRLIRETSPYLRQHAHNPVDWYPWGEDAFSKAKSENKAVLLSVGYSACHWCHVMEHESFESEEIAAVMNELFVNIKVDREERPDIDQIYQNALQLFGRNGGWPLTMFLTPEGHPFFGGTYFPPQDRYGISGFPKILAAVAEAFRDRREEILQTTQEVLRILSQRSQVQADLPQEMSLDAFNGAVAGLARLYDPSHGGFGSAPKFPNTMVLTLFLRHYLRTREDFALETVTHTLRRMAEGGIYDQLGGGFHRYSVDDRWLVPHFEKMLYDNALLARLYIETYQVTKDPFFRRVAEETLGYVLREMQDATGGFYSTQDADSEGEEGRYFVWTPEEVRLIVGPEDADLFCRAYDISETGNFEHKNILHADRPLKALVMEFGKPETEIEEILKRSREKLLSVRETRIKPHRDEKILTSWNGLMISAFAAAYQAAGNPVYLDAAQKAAGFVLNHLHRDGRLLRVSKDGQHKLNAYLDDYAFFSASLIDLFEASLDTAYLDHADRLVQTTLDQFWDESDGGFFFTGKDHEALIHRPKSGYDQAIPSGNGVATMNLLRLAVYRDNKEYAELGERLLRLYYAAMRENPFGFAAMFHALDFHLQGPKEIVIAGSKTSPRVREMISGVQGLYLPNKVLYTVDPANPPRTVPEFAKGKEPSGQPAAATVCHHFTCSVPVTAWPELEKLLTR